MRHKFSSTSTFAVPAGLALAAAIAVALPAPRAAAEDARATAPAAVGAPAPLAAALAAGAEDRAVAAFYAARDGAPYWLAEGGQGADALLAALADAGAHALPAAQYGAGDLAEAVAALSPTASPAERAAVELRLTEAYLAYARDLRSGLLDPRRIDRELDLDPPRADRATRLARLASAGSAAAALAGLAPDHADYARLVERLARYRALAEGEGWGPTVPEGPTLREGDRGPRVAALVKRLAAMGDLDEETAALPGDGTVLAANDITTDVGPEATAPVRDIYDAAVVKAVRRFQERHGLNTDGLVGPATRRAINRSPGYRARQIAVNLERLRWTNRPLGDRHVMVNLPGFRVALVEDGRETFTSRVVIGKRQHQTTEFSDEMEFMVVNPMWNVPRSIVSDEILPALRKDPTYLARKNMELVGVEMDPALIAWEFITPQTFPGRVRQLPGPGNALGSVKFKFPNRHAIYLHDTPQKSLFRRDVRAYSHGCVRVMEPEAFAHALLRPQYEDPARSFDRWRQRSGEVYVHLDRHVPVHITYRTAPVVEGAPDQFRGDVYGRDRRIAEALEKAGVALPPA